MVGARHSYALAELAQDFRDTTAPLAVIGLGYVGVALAATLAEAGFAVVGVDHDAERVTTLRAGTLPFVGDEPALGPMLHAALHAEKLRITTSMAHVGAAAPAPSQTTPEHPCPMNDATSPVFCFKSPDG